MPVNLFSIAVAWLATHLVALSLSGFLLVGLLIFGVIEAPGPVAVQTTDRATAPAKPGSDQVAPRTELPQPKETVTEQAAAEAPRPVVGGAETGRAGSDQGPVGRPQPRLIGGSLPVYGQDNVSPSAADSTSNVANEAFRPPFEEPDPVSLTREDYLQEARRAFWNGEFEKAEAAYMTLVSAYPADADAFGELGNLYQSMGKTAQALDAYYEAAVRLKAAGETENLNEVMELLRREGHPGIDQLTP